MALHRFRRGLDIPLAGSPRQSIESAASVSRVALLADDYVGLKPSFRVQPGDRVRRGQVLFEDAKNGGIRFTSPGGGTVAAINRGERRAFRSIVVDLDADDDPDAQPPFEAFASRQGRPFDAASVRSLLQESGLWTSFRTRPFSRVPSPEATAAAIFVTAIDTRPHAPDPIVVLGGRENDFELGVAGIQHLTQGNVYLCTPPEPKLPRPQAANVVVEEFAGPHPAGNAGTHIHVLQPPTLERPVWSVGYQDVVAVGHLLRTGRLDLERVVSLAGPAVRAPRLLRTRVGADLAALTRGALTDGDNRVISGSVLDGRIAMGDVEGYLGRYHCQVSALPEGRQRQMFGWIGPGTNKFSIWRVVAGALARRPLPLNTSLNGSHRPLIPIGGFERVMPQDLMPTFLIRALLTEDIEKAEALGVLELDEEDLALCTFVDPGKHDFGPLLRKMLDRIAKES
jgi:Na+-transporting NADH:ubiquinone oxidoreductase subunit A